MQKLIPLLSLTLLLAIFSPVRGQNTGIPDGNPPSALKGDGSIEGILLDTLSKKPVEFATVALVKITNDVIVDGTVVDEKGVFEIKDIPDGEYYLDFGFLGYQSKRSNSINIINGSKIKLGRIYLTAEALILQGVTVEGQVDVVEEKSFMVLGVERQFLVYNPVHTATNIVLVFHGNGGTALGFANKYHIHNHLTESITVYIQGIPGIGGGFDPKGLKNGWQRKAGDGGDRDLHFMDVLIPQLRLSYPGLKESIFAFGHSNGGRFVYLLWSLRAEYFKGFIINAHQGVDLLALALARKCMVITGSQDKVVNNANQLKSADMIKQILETDESKVVNEQLTIYTNSHSEYFLYHYIHGGGHDVPKSALPFVNEFMLKR